MGILSVIMLVLVLFFTGCGSKSGVVNMKDITAPSIVAEKGIYVDQSYFDKLEQEFNETVTCTGLEGNFWDISIFLMPPPSFPCNGDNLKGKICYGEFIRPNKILLGTTSVWKHEVIHYLLYKNRGDLDPDHKSELFHQCS